MNWAEVTLLEAIRFFGFLECVPWEEAAAMLEHGICQKRLGDGVLFRGDRLASVGEAERSQPRVFHRRLADAVDALAAARAA